MLVHEVAERAGVSAHVVRYYARIGLIDEARQTGNGYRRFGDDAVSRIRCIMEAKAFGLTLKEIRELLDSETSRGGLLNGQRAESLLKMHLEETKREIAELEAQRARLEQVLSSCLDLGAGVKVIAESGHRSIRPVLGTERGRARVHAPADS